MSATTTELLENRRTEDENQRGTAGTSGTVADPSVEVTLVVPFYNSGAAALRQTVRGAAIALTGAGVSWEIVAVSDGSTDGSEDGVRDLLSDSVHLVVLPENVGKGHAVRRGLVQGRGRYLGFVDGDGDIPVALLGDFVDVIRSQMPDIVVGSKRHPDSRVSYPGLRRAYSAGYQAVTRLLFGLQVRDTQTGIKLARRQVLDDVLPLMREDRFAFDVELLALAQRIGYRHVVEAPVTIRRRVSSTVSMRTVGSMIRDTVAIAWRLRVSRSYELRASRRARGNVPSNQLAEVTSAR
jgi:glycosyltransferase involved in cell wall biosynthesis